VMNYFYDKTGINSADISWSEDVSEDIYVMPIVIRLERDAHVSHEDALLSTAYAIAKYFLSPLIDKGNVWHEPTQKWMQSRIRKVAKRARASAFDKVQEMDNISYSHNDTTVLVFPPVLSTKQPPEIYKLQAQGLDLPKEGFETNLDADILVAYNPDVAMSTGKTMAQIAHAVQMSIMQASRECIEKWEQETPVISLAPFSLLDEWDVKVQDAGLTEVPPGTLTAVAYRNF